MSRRLSTHCETMNSRRRRCVFVFLRAYHSRVVAMRCQIRQSPHRGRHIYVSRRVVVCW